MHPAPPKHAALGAVVVSILLSVAPAAADPLSDAEIKSRLAFIEARLKSGTAASNRWWDAWFYGWTAFTVTQAAVACATTDRGLRIDMAVGAVSSSLGVIPLGLFPLPSRHAAAKLAALPGATPDDRRRKLGRAEHLLKESAEAEALGRSWFNHALGGAVSLGFGLLLGFAYKRPVAGVINTLGGIALVEIQIFTQPTAAIDDFRTYQRFRLKADGLGVSGRF